MYALFLVHFVATIFMLGLIWFVQIVHYPSLMFIGHEAFTHYETMHIQETTLLVALPMLIELITAFLLVWKTVPHVSQRLLWINCGLLIIIWLSSFCLQVPMHIQLASGFDSTVHYYLVCSNWIRTVLWSVRSCLLTAALYYVLNKLPQHD